MEEQLKKEILVLRAENEKYKRKNEELLILIQDLYEELKIIDKKG